MTAAPQTVPTRTGAGLSPGSDAAAGTANDEAPEAARPWVTVVHNDPVNLMTYVTWVLQQLFGYSRDRAESLMLDVHHKGRAIVTSGARERMEHDASRLHQYGLWATVDRS